MAKKKKDVLPPIKFDPTITIDISKERKALDEKIWDMTNTKNLTEPEKERLMFRAAKLRSIFNDLPEEIQESTIGVKVQPGD